MYYTIFYILGYIAVLYIKLDNITKFHLILHFRSELLPQVKEFLYLSVLFTSEGKVRRIGGLVWRLQQYCRLPVGLNLTDGHEIWVVTERMTLRIQAEFPP